MLFGCVWLCLIMFDYVWLCFDYVWLCLIMFDYVWLTVFKTSKYTNTINFHSNSLPGTHTSVQCIPVREVMWQHKAAVSIYGCSNVQYRSDSLLVPSAEVFFVVSSNTARIFSQYKKRDATKQNVQISQCPFKSLCVFENP